MEKIYLREFQVRRYRDVIGWILLLIMILICISMNKKLGEMENRVEDNKSVYEVSGKFGIPFDSKINDGEF